MAEKRNIVGFIVKSVGRNTEAAMAGVANKTPVDFSGGESCILDWSDPRASVWSQVLEAQRETGGLTFVELDAETNTITQVLLPDRVLVNSITPSLSGDSVEVALHVSHAKHYLHRSNPDFQQLHDRLLNAMQTGQDVVVTETLDGHEIIDVREAAREEGRSFLDRTVLERPAVRPFAAVTPAIAKHLFDLVNSQTCNPLAASSSCIPFLYPDDGCWGRAHEMCRLMIADGAQPRKVWIYGSLRVKTSNNPNCEVRWGWHVAPTLLVEVGASSQIQVIDPSMFGGPVPQATWSGAQGDPSARLKDSEASVFYRDESGGSSVTDPSYAETKRVLDRYRNLLKLRSAGPGGPPPYAHCSP